GEKTAAAATTNNSQPPATVAAQSTAAEPQAKVAEAQPTPAAEPQPMPTPAVEPTPQPTPLAEPTPTPTPTPSPQPTPAPETTSSRQRTVTRASAGGGQCVFSVQEEPLTIRSNGGSIIIPVTFDGPKGAAGIEASTPDWADIAVFAEPKTNIESGVFNYSITSVNKRSGTFTADFKTPCGTKKVTIIVK
ncbi:MAG TPA: hypothetical protein VGC64_05265, partial [Pyrinomonadaceae bacterium]